MSLVGLSNQPLQTDLHPLRGLRLIEGSKYYRVFVNGEKEEM